MSQGYNFDNMVDWRSLVTTLGHMSAALGLLDQASDAAHIAGIYGSLFLKM